MEVFWKQGFLNALFEYVINTLLTNFSVMYFTEVFVEKYATVYGAAQSVAQPIWKLHTG